MSEVGLAQLAEQTGVVAGILATRYHGQRFLPLLATAITQLSSAAALLVDGRGVSILDASFADEVFGVIAAGRPEPSWKGKCFALWGLTSDNVANIAAALDSRVLHSTGLRNCTLPIVDDVPGSGIAHLIGKAEGHVQETFAAVVRRRKCTARDIADGLGLDIHAASTRLKVLHDLGLATRTSTEAERGGREYLYAWPF